MILKLGRRAMLSLGFSRATELLVVAVSASPIHLKKRPSITQRYRECLALAGLSSGPLSTAIPFGCGLGGKIISLPSLCNPMYWGTLQIAPWFAGKDVF